MTSSNVRVAGSNFTTFVWNGTPIAYLESISDSGVSPVGRFEKIHPLGAEHPTEWALPNAVDSGQFTMTIRELWNAPVWQQLQGFAQANNILDIYRALNALTTEITCQTIIKPPNGGQWRLKTYHNVIITSIDDTESVSIEAMSIPRVITCAYTHSTRSTIAGS